jgi:hypothetical protein
VACSKTHRANVAALVNTLERQLDQQYARPHVKRDAHPKMHGCVQAILKVDHQTGGDASKLRRGIFETPREYPAWVRFSNAFRIQHDLELETRGMAIKLLGVEGNRALPEGLENDRDVQTQDFLLATFDAFFIPNSKYNYKQFAAASDTGGGALIGFFVRNRLWRGLWAMLRSAFVLASNPLAITYYSQTPYRFGPVGAEGRPVDLVKIRARPLLGPALKRSLPFAFWFRMKTIAATIILSYAQSKGAAAKEGAEDRCDRYLASRDLLRHALMKTLSTTEAVFEIAVQFRTGSEASMPEDNATKRWSEWASPFRRVAELRIPCQVFWPEQGMPRELQDATVEMMKLGENMSFNPWHARAEHTPVGSINDMRRQIYTAMASFRRSRNAVEQPIPTVAQYRQLQEVVQFGRLDGPPAQKQTV